MSRKPSASTKDRRMMAGAGPKGQKEAGGISTVQAEPRGDMTCADLQTYSSSQPPCCLRMEWREGRDGVEASCMRGGEVSTQLGRIQRGGLCVLRAARVIEKERGERAEVRPPLLYVPAGSRLSLSLSRAWLAGWQAGKGQSSALHDLQFYRSRLRLSHASSAIQQCSRYRIQHCIHTSNFKLRKRKRSNKLDCI